MAEYDIPIGFRDVDAAKDPGVFVRFLDAAGSLDFFQRVKADMLALLDVKPDQRILDVGCATGDDVRTLSRLVGPGGRAVGVDQSRTMIAEARERSEGQDFPGEFVEGDAAHLDFPDELFDSCRSDRLFIHLADPRPVIAEMLRVTRPGARIVACETDSGTRALDMPDREITQRILDVSTATYGNAWAGRQLAGLFKEAGLEEIVVIPHTRIQRDFAIERPGFWRPAVDRAVGAGAITSAEAERWWRDMEEAVRDGRYFYATTYFIVAGRKPLR
jgi:ubiquinone/menaquinone biosynthesis C-methylase UbiE